jgi:hypothetical protein
MPRFKTPDYGLKMIPVDFDQQVIPGSFEHALCYLVDHEIDFAGLEARYRNDTSGAPAFAPAVLLKIVLLAYSRGLISSRAIATADSAPEAVRAARTLERVKKEAAQIRAWLDGNPEERRSAKGKVRLSNRTDNESAKMATGKGVIQGYTGVAAVDAKAQIVIDAQAHGTGSEQELLLPVIESTAPNRIPATAICADAGYHSETNLKALADHGIDAWICDNDYRSRDVRYAGQAKHKAKPDPLWDKAKSGKKTRCFTPADFSLAADRTHCVCPAGERLYSNGSNCTFNGYAAMKYRGAERNCVPCELRTQCLRKPDTSKTRQVAFFQGRRSIEESHTERMKRRIDSDTGKRMITARFATVEPVFGNLRANKRLQRFTLRGQKKVDGQWKLYCLVHNIEKLAHHGYAQ